ncbi:cytochrome P460 family protein [Pelagibius litoralis]|uniref:Cytochrome P460 family protein n=1 Tax=Pelagibius litoralis TaxID=374515 RepID=A0A967C6H6_9PROT|nr:cytochrome P460 family protein [Pelagibius litoralis]NIA67237.1 cytochrome P460 family protein [Pelagibius litoralis]
MSVHVVAFAAAVFMTIASAVATGVAAQSITAAAPDQEAQYFDDELDDLDEPRRAYRVQSPAEPNRHDRVQNPAELTAEEAAAIYNDLADDLAATYALSGDPVTAGYRDWQRFNAAPYKSMTHGRRYVNNYANEIAARYGRYEAAGRLPVGSVVAKDSFVVTDDGATGPGPLFVMEKMAESFNYVTGDWRYSMISATGELLGRTNGQGADRVEFCISCHLAVEDQDHLFFVPEEARLAPGP